MKRSTKTLLIKIILAITAIYFVRLLYFSLKKAPLAFSSKKIKTGKKNILVLRDHAWFAKQTKYMNGAKIERITFTSPRSSESSDDIISRNGILCIEPNAPATILICHGFMTCKDDIGIFRSMFKGYNVMTFDFRAHGENIDNQCCTFGCEEMNDVIAAARFLKSHKEIKNKPLIVYGFSMGAVASILAQAKDSTLFDFAIWDCPFDSANDLISRTIERMKVSFFGYEFPLPGRSFLKKYVYHPYVQDIFKSSLKSIIHMDSTKINTDIRPISPKEAIKSIKIPMMLITCHNDDKAPPAALLELYKNATQTPFKRLWIAMGRYHFDPIFLNPEKYVYKIRKKIEDFLSGFYKKKIKEKIKEDQCIYEVV